MPTYSSGLGIELINDGDRSGTWGSVTNNNLNALEEGVMRYSEVAVTTTTSNLNIPNAQTAETDDSRGRSAIIKFTGNSGGANHTVTLQVAGVSADRGNVVFINGLDSTYTLTVEASGGAGNGVTIPNGYAAHLYIEESGGASDGYVLNALGSLSVDKISLENGEVISNSTNNEVAIVSQITSFGDTASSGIVESSGNYDLVLRSGRAADPSAIVISGTTANGDITLTPDGTGSVVAADILRISGTTGYLNFNATSGSGGYGVRDNSGFVEVRHSGDASWGQPYTTAMETGDGAYFESAATAFTANSTTTAAHDFGAVPRHFTVSLRCSTIDSNWQVDDEILIASGGQGSGNVGAIPFADSTNVGCVYGSDFQILNKTGFTVTGINEASWRMVLRAWK